jgi:hypothetical protein
MSRAARSPPSSKKSPPPRNALVPLDDVQHFVMEGASWELYERLLRDIGNRPIQVTYDEGRLEVMSPLPEHERQSRFHWSHHRVNDLRTRHPDVLPGVDDVPAARQAKGT